MSLSDISGGYYHAAVLIAENIERLKAELEECVDPERAGVLKYRIGHLRRTKKELEQLGVYCERYYESGFYIAEGAFPARRRSTKRKAEKKAHRSVIVNNIERTAHGTTRGGVVGVEGWEASNGVGSKTWRKCVNSIEKLPPRF